MNAFPHSGEYFEADVVEEGLLLVTFRWKGNPLNNISDAVVDEMETVFDYAAALNDIVALVIIGKGPVFSTGAWLPELADQTPHGAQHLSRKGTRIFSLLDTAPFASCAAINGLCLGGGLELALSCDFRVASARARMGLTEATLGLVPGWGGAQRLTMEIGFQAAKEMILTGRQVRAQEALELGLVSSVHPHGDLLEAAKEKMRPIVATGRQAVRLARRSIYLLMNTTLRTAMEVQSDFFAQAWDNPNSQGLVRDFLAKQGGGGDAKKGDADD